MFSSTKFIASVFIPLFVSAAVVLLPVVTVAQCAQQWDASGIWEIRQGPSGGSVIRLDLTQSGGAVSGSASRTIGERGASATKTQKGDAIGDVDGATFTLSVEWPDGGGTHVYRGKVLSSGRAEGGMFIGSSQTARLQWYSEQALTCSWKSGKSRGNLTSKLSPGDPVKPSGVTPKSNGPVLVASVIALPPGMPGAAILQWHSGPDHPTAEVWMKSTGQGRTMLAKQPVGNLQVQIQRGWTYTYTLVADGKTIATFTLPVP